MLPSLMKNFFWKLIKGQPFFVSDDRFSSERHSLLTDRGKIVKCGPTIVKLWEPYLLMITLTAISVLILINRVREELDSGMNDPSGYLCEPFAYEEGESVCASLKGGISGVEIDYEHIRFAGPPLWKLLFQLYQDFNEQFV